MNYFDKLQQMEKDLENFLNPNAKNCFSHTSEFECFCAQLLYSTIEKIVKLKKTVELDDSLNKEIESYCNFAQSMLNYETIEKGDYEFDKIKSIKKMTEAESFYSLKFKKEATKELESFMKKLDLERESNANRIESYKQGKIKHLNEEDDKENEVIILI